MENHHKIVLGMALCLGVVTYAGCTTVKPGTQLLASYEETAAKRQCQGTSNLVVEKAELKPSKITPGRQIVSRIVYASCYGTSLKGKIIRKVIRNGETVITLPEDIEYMPGTWTLTAHIAIPPRAAPGGYMLETKIQARALRLQETNMFEVVRE
jgi:hypothetical protein